VLGAALRQNRQSWVQQRVPPAVLAVNPRASLGGGSTRRPSTDVTSPTVTPLSHAHVGGEAPVSLKLPASAVPVEHGVASTTKVVTDTEVVVGGGIPINTAVGGGHGDTVVGVVGTSGDGSGATLPNDASAKSPVATATAGAADDAAVVKVNDLAVVVAPVDRVASSAPPSHTNSLSDVTSAMTPVVTSRSGTTPRRIVALCAAPLCMPLTTKVHIFADLNFDRERRHIWQALASASRDIEFDIKFATSGRSVCCGAGVVLRSLLWCGVQCPAASSVACAMCRSRTRGGAAVQSCC
jgi:hypothetical protein